MSKKVESDCRRFQEKSGSCHSGFAEEQKTEGRRVSDRLNMNCRGIVQSGMSTEISVLEIIPNLYSNSVLKIQFKF